ncbi:pyroglutamyl-peptidase I [Variovorax saccharolyticus]|uniref:pyroglutamyl-peptidase I n=1 Tax=Variovorax saccharolyticus TaxID=3053516 RepID=UPI002576AAA0|nr:pyroglutamyl-peptidase I [Variovorax sp. J31P216]MDM0025817.1 pyroglutamyl-peptidase I [Variovorax sp. J31P216]
MNILLTGFEPFEAEAVNPSWEAVRALDGWRLEGAVVHARRISCVFGTALRELDAAIDELQPQLVLAVGQAGGRAELTPERVAINVDDGRICDNAGCQPIDLPVVAGAPAAYFATLPIKAMVRDLRAAGIPAAVSNTAGTFVCNHLFFGLMHRIATRPVVAMRGGFIHIPYLPEQVARRPGLPSMALDTVVAGLRIAITTALAVREDVRETGGQLH